MCNFPGRKGPPAEEMNSRLIPATTSATSSLSIYVYLSRYKFTDDS